MKWVFRVLIFMTAVFAFLVAPEKAFAGLLTEPGYLSDVQNEKKESFYEIFLFKQAPPVKSDLSHIIFNQQLSKEFRDKYREKFGQVDTESIVYQPTKFSVMDENRGAVLKIERDQESRRSFGEYMVKRLLEWHVDNYFKTDPTMRPVYELKEKLSNVEVQVNEETKVNIQYNFSDNSLDFNVINPYAESKLTLVMDSKSFGPGPIQDEKVIVEKQVSRKVRLNSWLKNRDGIVYGEVLRALPAHWAVSSGIQAAFKPGGPSFRETRYLIGLSHAY